MTNRILVLPGDGIGPEITAEAVKVLDACYEEGFDMELVFGKVGGDAIDATGVPLPDETLKAAHDADAILLGAVGGPKWEALEPREHRPEKGLLGIRKGLELYANLRPAILYPQLANASALRPEVVSGLDIMIVRELTGDIYFGEPRGFGVKEDGTRYGYNTYISDEKEIRRIGRTAFDLARKRDRKVCSVDKANVLEASMLWREIMNDIAKDYPDVELSHMYIDNASMQLVRAPKQFDVIVTGNMFGDILSDEASMLTGSIGMLPSASLNASGQGMFEPSHGSAPDIAGQNIANPLATILSASMMLRYSLEAPELADRIERAVGDVLDQGLRTPDIMEEGARRVSTSEMGDAVVEAFKRLK